VNDVRSRLSFHGAYLTPLRQVSYVQAILNAVQGNLNIDVNRIYAVGFSNGGGLTNLLACTGTMSKNFAAFATSSPALYNGTLASNGCNTGGHPVALIDFHGLADGQIVRVFLSVILHEKAS
jgi:poly(3-hydroxybutyrate) depolymerase